MKFVEGKICDIKSGYILQTCNCTGIYSFGISKEIEDVFSISPYSSRKNFKGVSSKDDISIPGTVMILGNEDSPQIVNMFVQYNPGNSGITDYFKFMLENAYGKDDPVVNVSDSDLDREKYFNMCLEGLYDFFEFTGEEVVIHVPYSNTFPIQSLRDFENKMIDSGVKLQMYVYC